jgi:hypothetical protein
LLSTVLAGGDFVAGDFSSAGNASFLSGDFLLAGFFPGEARACFDRDSSLASLSSSISDESLLSLEDDDEEESESEEEEDEEEEDDDDDDDTVRNFFIGT